MLSFYTPSVGMGCKACVGLRALQCREAAILRSLYVRTRNKTGGHFRQIDHPPVYCCRPLSPPISWLYLVPEATSSSRRKKSPEAARYRDLIHKGPPLFNLSSCLLLSCALLSEFMGEGGNCILFKMGSFLRIYLLISGEA